MPLYFFKILRKINYSACPNTKGLLLYKDLSFIYKWQNQASNAVALYVKGSAKQVALRSEKHAYITVRGKLGPWRKRFMCGSGSCVV